MTANVLQSLQNTTLPNGQDRSILGKYLKKAFEETISDALKSEEILVLAWKFQVPQFDEMFEDHQNHNYPHFNC